MISTRRARVVGLGLVMADLQAVCAAAPLSENDRRVRALRLRLGGATANVLVTLRRRGVDTSLVSVVGDDWIGDFLLDRLDESGVGRRDVTVVAGSSASCLVLETPPTRTLLWHLPEQLEDGLGLDRARLARLVADADTVHVNGRFPHAAQELCSLARARGVTVSVNAGRGDVSAGVPELLPYADVLVAADSWATEYTGAATAQDACARLADASPDRRRMVSVTCGERGSWSTGPGQKAVVHTPPPVAPGGTVLTAGAGDAYQAGFLTAVLAGSPPEECARAGADEVGRFLAGTHEESSTHDSTFPVSS